MFCLFCVYQFLSLAEPAQVFPVRLLHVTIQPTAVSSQPHQTSTGVWWCIGHIVLVASAGEDGLSNGVGWVAPYPLTLLSRLTGRSSSMDESLSLHWDTVKSSVQAELLQNSQSQILRDQRGKDSYAPKVTMGDLCKAEEFSSLALCVLWGQPNLCKNREGLLLIVFVCGGGGYRGCLLVCF